MRVRISPSSSPSPRRPRSRVKKNVAVLKKATTRKNSTWSSGGWQTQTMRRCTRTQDELERSLPHSGLTGFLAKDKKSIWAKSYMESSKRESEVMVMADELDSGEKLDEQTGAKMKKGLKHLRKVRDEGKAVKELLEEVQERRLHMEDEMWQELDKNIFSWEPWKRRSGSLIAQFGNWYKAATQRRRTWSTTSTRSLQKSGSWVVRG